MTDQHRPVRPNYIETAGTMILPQERWQNTQQHVESALRLAERFNREVIYIARDGFVAPVSTKLDVGQSLANFEASKNHPAFDR
jgi:hypothetical protein